MPDLTLQAQVALASEQPEGALALLITPTVISDDRRSVEGPVIGFTTPAVNPETDRRDPEFVRRDIEEIMRSAASFPARRELAKRVEIGEEELAARPWAVAFRPDVSDAISALEGQPPPASVRGIPQVRRHASD